MEERIGYATLAEALNAAVTRLTPHDASLSHKGLADLVERMDAVKRVAEVVVSDDRPRNLSPALSEKFRFVIRDDLLFSLANFLELLKAAGGLVVGLSSLPTVAGFKTTADALHAL